MEADEGERSAAMKVLMLPWLAHGHLHPYLELANRLIQHHHNNGSIHVHLVSTPINLNSIQQQDLNQNIKLVELHLPNVPGLDGDPCLHATKHLPSHLMPILKTASDLSEMEFVRILDEVRPDLVLYDFIQHWAPKAANRLKIPAVLFLTTGAAFLSFGYHYAKKRDEMFPFPEISQGKDQDISYTDQLKGIANGITDVDRLLESISLSSSFVAIKTFREIESKYIDYLSSLMGKELVPVGPLVPDPKDRDHESCKKLIEWLSKKERSSVLFVSFGSEYFMNEEEIEEIAYGLEFSKVNFIWVIRFPGRSKEVKEKSLHGAKGLPSGFAERIGDNGLVLEAWAPQREILSHPSTGGFLTHCGWSSVMEGMRFGVPMLTMPLQLDQPLNAKLVVELGVGIEIKGEAIVGGNGGTGPAGTGSFGGFKRVFKREEIAKVIRDVIASEKAMKVRNKAKEMAELMEAKGNQEISLLVEKMAFLCTGGKKRTVWDLRPES